MGNTGWIKLWRAIDDNELLSSDNTCYVVFGKLLTHANHKTGSYRTGRYRLAALCNMKPSTVRDALCRLQAATMIRQQTDSKATTIYICNWKKYQQPDDSRPSPERQQTDTKQEERRRNIDTNVSMSSSDELKPLHAEICSIFGKNPERYKFLPTRRQTLKVRIKDTGRENIIKACKALSQSAFHMGENDRAWVADPYWALSSAAKAETWSQKHESQTTDLSNFEIEEDI